MSEDPENMALASEFPDEYWSGFETRDECFEWCRETKKELGQGTCCGNAFEVDLMSGETYTYCALYDSEEGEYDEMMEEIYPEWALFYSARPMNDRGAMEQANGWFEETFGDSANQMIAAIASLATVAAMNA